ncbi:MFS transporter [Nocardia puris]|uniref:DHA2 family multidrug resistance protein-like MFS transporter n=1 Tax=Nocardia puris TaxID=208602 RepID=A0A366CXC6_9NOCA|nr:MFS transporter [Nocardia puris]MBF6211907.1 MFS transporter [Nocardia puris]MBF6366933.1 MFS transporter [Nocardia puris]RBO82490.1 DHA2 family multidrug resistance protein-like MFS transporter [Nocardia puris]
MTAQEIPAKAGRREWLGLGLLAAPLLVLALDVSVLFLATPHLSAELRPSATQQLWILDIYGFLIAGFLITMGGIGDRIGRRRLLLLGGAAFAVASVIAAYAPSAELLIAARALLGVAGATLMPSTLGLISTMFRDPHQRTFAIAIWMTVFSAGVAIGPVVGGVVLEFFWWGAVFLIGVPVMLVLLVFGPALLPEHRQADGAKRIDPLSVGLSLATMLPVAYGVKEMAARGVSVDAVLVLVAGIVAGVLFVRRQLRSPDPLLDVRLFTRRAFAGAVALMMLGTLTVNGIYYLTPQYLQLVRDISPLGAGLWLVPVALVSVVASLLTPRFARRYGRRAVLACAALIAAGACVGILFIGTGTALPLVLACVALATFGATPTGVIGTDLVVGSVPPERAGSAAAVSETAGELGVALGIATTGSLLAATYRSRLPEAAPDGLPDGVLDNAREGVASALDIAAGLPGELGAALAEAARSAFTAGFALAGAFGAVLLLGVVVLARTVVPAETPDPEEAEAQDDSATAGVPPA